MKNIMRLSKFTFLFLALASIVGCVKKDDFYKKNTNETSRKQTVQIMDASDIIAFARDVKTTNDTFVLIDVRRYPSSPAELNQPLTVKLTKNPGLIDAYNSANGTSYTELPANAYTLLSDINTLTFQPGEAVKEIKISIDQTKLDFSQQYALAFSIADPGSNAIAITSLKDAIYDIGVKNKYDGVYSVVSGTVTRYTNPTTPAGDALSGSLVGNPDVQLITAGANTVAIPPPGPGSIQWAAGNNSYVAGIDGLRITIDPVTNLTTITSQSNGTLANWAGHENRYDPATKTFYLAFRWNPTSTVREYEIVLKYKGKR